MMLPRILLIALVVVLGACAGLKPVPVDRYYRLPELRSSEYPDQKLSNGVLYVSLLETDGLHRERAMVYTDNMLGLELRQYHYQHWIDTPPRMIRDHLVSYLRAINAAPTVVTSVDPYPQLEISGKLRRFDRVISDADNAVTVALELQAEMDGELIHIADYSATEQVSGESVEDAVAAFNGALVSCFEQFVKDVNTAR